MIALPCAHGLILQQIVHTQIYVSTLACPKNWASKHQSLRPTMKGLPSEFKAYLPSEFERALSTF